MEQRAASITNLNIGFLRQVAQETVKSIEALNKEFQ